MKHKKHEHPQEQQEAGHKDPMHRGDEHEKKDMGHEGTQRHKDAESGDMQGDEDPEKKIQIDDNPDETKKKIPHMER